MPRVDSRLLRTPLAAAHRAAGARLAPFAGWLMPMQYQGIVAEARAVRTAAGVFDVSHMGRLAVDGADAAGVLDAVLTFSVERLAPGRARYGFILNERGGIIDDVILYRDGPAAFRLVCNAATRETVIPWLTQHGAGRVGFALRDDTLSTALVAVQGPDAVGIVDALCAGAGLPSGLRPFASAQFTLALGRRHAGVAAHVGRTGYTGEDGVEIALPAGDAPALWRALLAAGAVPCGLGARDVLRLEAGLRLNHVDMDADTTPPEAGLERFVHMDKGGFVGREALERQLAAGLTRVQTGFRLLAGGVPRSSCAILRDGAPVGVVTSGTYSPVLDVGIALGYVDPDTAAPGRRVHVDLRGRLVEAVVTAPPFYRRPTSRLPERMP